MEIGDAAQDNEAVARLQDIVGMESYEDFLASPDAHDVDLEACTVVQVPQRLASSSFGDGYLEDVVVWRRLQKVIQAGEAETVGKADGHVMFREDDVVCPDAQQKPAMQVRGRPGNQMLDADFLEDRGGQHASLDFGADGQDHRVAVRDARGLELIRVGAVCNNRERDFIPDAVDVLLLVVNGQYLKVDLCEPNKDLCCIVVCVHSSSDFMSPISQRVFF